MFTNKRKDDFMNKQECDILLALSENSFVNQRILAECTRHSLGMVNCCIKNLKADGYLDKFCQLTQRARTEINNNSPKNAIILAAGVGMRMVPINTVVPKAMLEVHGEPLIERLIKQLHEVNITEIYIVVGFMKECFEYLIDRYGVKLIINEMYAKKNNLHSLALASGKLMNAYIVPCDIWCKQNPFHKHELYSWYMVSELLDNESDMCLNRKMELVKIQKEVKGNQMIGIAYLTKADTNNLCVKIMQMDLMPQFNDSFWEQALFLEAQMRIKGRAVDSSEVIEINTYEQLRNLDDASAQLDSDAIRTITTVFGCIPSEITNIAMMKKGMTNRSFLFSYSGNKYIMRLPGEGTDKLINRQQESMVYKALKDKRISDELLYINKANGFKITKFIEGARTCNPFSVEDIVKCMNKLRCFHDLRLRVGHDFDIFAQIEFYESLWRGKKSVYRDYEESKEKVFSLKSFVEAHKQNMVLTHIDAVPDNFLFTVNAKGREEIRLIDWEYAGMQDPHVDIAMFCIYSLYNKSQVDRLISIYFKGECRRDVRIKIYCYIAACGLLWSNWCEYKQSKGVEFGEYSIRQYRYAKEYYRIIKEEIKCIK